MPAGVTACQPERVAPVRSVLTWEDSDFATLVRRGVWAIYASRTFLISICVILATGIRLETASARGSDTRAVSGSRHTIQAVRQPSQRSITFSSVQARADSIAALSALLLVAQREGDFPFLLKYTAEERIESHAIQHEILLLMDEMDPQLARRGDDLATFLVQPPNLLQAAEAQQTLDVLLPFIQCIPESLSSHGTFCLAAGIMLRETGQHALAGRYFEKASRPGFPLAAHALCLAVESARASREIDRLLGLEKRLKESTAPDYLLKRARLAAALALSEAGRESDAQTSLESLLRGDVSASDRAKAGVALGKLHEARGDYDRAAGNYALAFETGASGEAVVEASRAYLRLVREERIVEDVSKSLLAARWLVRAELRSEARPVLEGLFHRGKLRLEAGWDLARLHYRTKKYAEAAKVFRSLETMGKGTVGSAGSTGGAGSERALLWVARCERQLSKTEIAIALFRRAALVGKRIISLEAAWELALELESLGRLSEAASMYELLHVQFPETRLGQEALWRKGLCEYKRGSIKQAQTTFASSFGGKGQDWIRDAALFWMLKCSAEGGAPVLSAELAKGRPRSDSLYGLLLEGISRIVGEDTLSLENVEIGRRIGKERFKIPWIDSHASRTNSISRGPAKGPLVSQEMPATSAGKRPLLKEGPVASAEKTGLQVSPELYAPRLSQINPTEAGLSDGLPQDAERGALLLEFGLRDLAIEELHACEKEFSGNGDALFLIAQLYWRNGLYREALSLSERLLKRGQEMEEGKTRFLERIAYPICYADVLLPESRAQAVDPFLVLAVIKRESTFNPRAVSPAGATGLMQLMPETAATIATYLGQDKQKLDLKNPDLNIRYGVWHLGRLIGRYEDSVVTALAAYNAGEDNAERWASAAGSEDGFVYMESVSYRETREYIRQVLTDLQVYRDTYAH